MSQRGSDLVDRVSEEERFSPVPIVVQGVALRPGDQVLIVERGKVTLRRYAGASSEAGEVYMEFDYPLSSTWEARPGPFRKDQLRHPCLLGAVMKEHFPPE